MNITLTCSYSLQNERERTIPLSRKYGGDVTMSSAREAVGTDSVMAVFIKPINNFSSILTTFQLSAIGILYHYFFNFVGFIKAVVMATAHVNLYGQVKEDDIPGAKLDKDLETLTVPQLKRWLQCRKGASQKGNKRELRDRLVHSYKSPISPINA